jgi:ABC-type nitrate/sulfonate/bicarbonate transport system substrate-binding protein
MNKRTVALIIFALLALLHTSVLLAQSVRKLESVTLGLSAKHVLNLPIYLAQRHGIFESEGFDYKPITTKTNTAIAALVSGDLDYITAFNSGLGVVSDELVTASIKRAQQDAKIGQSTFAPKDFVDWNLIRAVQQELKR